MMLVPVLHFQVAGGLSTPVTNVSIGICLPPTILASRIKSRRSIHCLQRKGALLSSLELNFRVARLTSIQFLLDGKEPFAGTHAEIAKKRRWEFFAGVSIPS